MTISKQTRSQDEATSDKVVEMIPLLRIYARNLTRGGADVDDLVQETLVKAIANIDRFQPGTNLRAWLFTIMRNSFLTGAMKRSREPVGGKDCVSGQVIAFPVHDAHMTCNRVMLAIRQLPDQYREALVLVFLVGESYQDVAQICDCAIGTVKSRISRGRQMLMDELQATKLRDLVAAYH